MPVLWGHLYPLHQGQHCPGRGFFVSHAVESRCVPSSLGYALPVSCERELSQVGVPDKQALRHR